MYIISIPFRYISINEEQSENIEISIIWFHLDISGKDNNDEHHENIDSIFFTLLVFHLDISGKDINDVHPQNIELIFFK